MNLMYVCLAANLVSSTESYHLLAFVYPKKTALKKDRPLGNVKGTE